jgi:hypothetical protein
MNLAQVADENNELRFKLIPKWLLEGQQAHVWADFRVMNPAFTSIA